MYTCLCTCIKSPFSLNLLLTFVHLLCCSDPNQAKPGVHKVQNYNHHLCTALRICSVLTQFTCFLVKLHVYQYVQYSTAAKLLCVCGSIIASVVQRSPLSAQTPPSISPPLAMLWMRVVSIMTSNHCLCQTRPLLLMATSSTSLVWRSGCDKRHRLLCPSSL